MIYPGYFATVCTTYQFIRDTFGDKPFTGAQYKEARPDDWRVLRWNNLLRGYNFMISCEKDPFTIERYVLMSSADIMRTQSDKASYIQYDWEREQQYDPDCYVAIEEIPVFRYVATLKPLEEVKKSVESYIEDTHQKELDRIISNRKHCLMTMEQKFAIL